MPDPYAPKRTQTASETQSPLDYVCDRLGRLGASPDEVEAVREAWDDPEWPVEERAALVHVSDSELVAELITARRDTEFHSLTPGEQTVLDGLREFDDAVAAVEEDAYKVTEGSVADVLAWVRTSGDERAVRAAAAHRWEQRGRGRRSALTALYGIVESEGPEGSLDGLSGAGEG